MRYFMLPKLAKSGAPYLVIYHPGKAFIATFAGLVKLSGGVNLTIISHSNTGSETGEKLTPVPQVSIAKVSRPAKRALTTVLTLARRSKVQNGICW
jgi:hypothetical protein